MNRCNLATLIVRALLFSVVVLLAGNRMGYAQQPDIDSVKAAIEAFDAALGSLDVSKMAPLWVHDATVTLINPRDKGIAVGWDAVKKDWEATFNANSELKITRIDGPYIQANGDVAWSTGMVNAAIRLKNGAALNAPTFEADVFQKRGSQWLLVSHAAWRVPK